ncbi:hypothetical protein HKX48_008935 [Thoreauomyces humboldtii]|nr:hypothetical protein HKX48_008935 [Thoreauomyces humboldtii]
MTIPVQEIIPLEAGAFVCGLVACLAFQRLTSHGCSFRLVHDRDRQRFLNGLCLLVAAAGLLSLGLTATQMYWQLQDACVMIIFVGVQLGLACLNHNTIVRFSISRGRTASRWWLALYPLAIVLLLPIWMSFPSAVHDGIGINRTHVNAHVYKPLNAALVLATEIFATVSDVLLLKKVLADDLFPGQRRMIRRNLLMQYFVVWASVALDILLKLLIFTGQPVLFDSQVTNLTLVLRAAANLRYGLTIRNIFVDHSTPDGLEAFGTRSEGSGLGQKPQSLLSGALVPVKMPSVVDRVTSPAGPDVRKGDGGLAYTCNIIQQGERSQ